MARPLRIELAGGLYHVTSRGVKQGAIYLSDSDRVKWLALLGEVCKRFNWICHAYCEMTNHYHIVIETPEANLSRGMRHLNGVYTQYVNRTHQRVGRVFHGRFKSILMEKDNYLLELVRNVVLNPVRANMVRQPEKWPWSSHNAMIGNAEAPEWLQIDWLLSQFGKSRRHARDKYRDFVTAGVGLPSTWGGLENQIFLGSEPFVRAPQNKVKDAGDINEMPRAQRHAQAKPLEYYEQRHRDESVAMAEAYKSGDYSLKAIADHFGVHYSTVSRAVKYGEKN